MYLPIGNDMSVRESSIIGIFDMDNTSTSKRTRDFLNRAQQDGAIISCDDLQCLQRYIRSGAGIAITAPYSWPDMGDPHIQFVKIDAQLSQQISRREMG